MFRAGFITVVSVAQAEAAVAGEEDATALVLAAREQSCVVANLRGFDAILDSSSSRPRRSSQVPRTQAKRKKRDSQPRYNRGHAEQHR
jgi:hypothetical protein